MSEQNKKQWFLVRIDGVAPVSIEYRIFAETEDAAFELAVKGAAPNVYLNNKPHISIPKLQKKKVSIKNLLTGWITWVRNF